MLINHNINSLNGGVTRQPQESRFDNQVQEMVNFVPDISGFISRRNPLLLVNTVGSDVFNTRTAMHSYDRGDGLEKYGIVINDGGLSVLDTNGVAKTVNIVDSNVIETWKATLGPSQDWKKIISFLTVGDTTWMLNKDIVAGMTSEVTTSYSNNKAFYWAKRSFDNGQGAGYTYKIVLNGHSVVERYPLGTNPVTYGYRDINTTSTTEAARRLRDAINANYQGLYNGFSAVAQESVLRISHASAFTFTSGDSWGNEASFGWTNKVAKIQDLPSKMSGFSESDVGVIEITGTDSDSFTSYYIKWTGENWTETAAGGILNTLNATTLPAKLVRQSNGTFSFGFNVVNTNHQGFSSTWVQRKKGDEDSNPAPSFNGNKISNMFFFKNRLGFTSEENVILSETGEYYNFWATTAMEVLDSDPIDAAVDSDTVSIIRNVNATAGSLTLWADNAQFVLSGGDVLSPATTRISKTSGYYCNNNIAPVLVDNEIVFFRVVNNEFDALSYSPASLNTDTSTASSITSHIKGYLPSTINNVVVSSSSNLIFFTDSADSHTIYVYRYYAKGTEKVMSSWFKWTFESAINAIEILDNVLFILCNARDIAIVNLDTLDINEQFYDFDSVTKLYTQPYESKVTLSRFNIQTRQDTRIIREPFYTKSIVISKEGKFDLDIINEERGTTKTVNEKNLNRKIFIGGNTSKVSLSMVSSYSTGCKINAISIEGVSVDRSRNY
jgi:hypothetical protein